MVTVAKIKIIANDIVNTVNKQQKLPERKDYNMRTCAWILASFILNPKSEVHAKKVKSAKKYDGEFTHDKLNKNGYTSLANQLIKHIKKTGEMPSSLKYGNKKIQTKVYIYGFASVVKYYFDHKAFPSKVWFSRTSFNKPVVEESNSDCKNPYKALPYNENEGCNAMGQNTDYYCACSMVQKMMYRLGYKINQGELAEVMGTTISGTGHSGIETGIAYCGRKFNVKFKVTWYNFSDLGWEKMGQLMCRKNTTVGNHVLYRDEWGHYEYPLTVNTSNDTMKVINSLGDYCGSCHCGYIEERNQSTHRRYMGGISQKSVLVIERV